MRLIRNESGIIVSFFMRFFIGLAIVAIVGFDVASIVFNRFRLDSTADELAIELSLDLRDETILQHSFDRLKERLKALIETDYENVSDARIVRNGTFVDPEGIVHVKLARDAETLIVQRISAIADWGEATGEGQSSIR